MAESEEELDSLLMKVKRRVKKFKTQNSKNKDHGIQFPYFKANW